MTRRIHVLVVDDEPAVRLSLMSVLDTYDIETSECDSASKALEFLEGKRPDCVLFDVRMPGMDGLTAQKFVAEKYPALPVIIMTGHGDVSMAVRAMKSGAFDFVEKPIDDEQLANSIRSAVAKAGAQNLQNQNRPSLQERFASLTERERTIAKMVSEGYSTAAIAANLEISNRTVDHHRAKILAKMQATTLPQLLRFLLAAM